MYFSFQAQKGATLLLVALQVPKESAFSADDSILESNCGGGRPARLRSKRALLPPSSIFELTFLLFNTPQSLAHKNRPKGDFQFEFDFAEKNFQ